MKLYHQFKDLFYYHPNMRKAILFLLILLISSYLYMFFHSGKSQGEKLELSEIAIILQEIENTESDLYSESQEKQLINSRSSQFSSQTKRYFENQKPVYNSNERFFFDPNRLGEDSLLLLGFHRYAAQNLIKYREAGGEFRSLADLQKIYYMDSAHLEQIKPFVRFPENRETEKAKPGNIYFEVNSAEASQLEQLRGIGQVLSERIVKFRDQLGGFYRLEQLKEVYHLSDSTYESILPHLFLDTAHVRKLDLNRVSYEELASHPYITYKQARIMANYRDQRGGVDSINQLYDIRAFDSSFVIKILPYFRLQMN